MWYNEAVIYQIYPLGLCGAPEENDGILSHRILKLIPWIEHIKKTGADTVLLNPLFESDRHGYDTRDYLTPDCRLGTEEDLKAVCDAFHDAGLRIIFDAVFNHVGRGFWAFKDVQEKRWDSPYKDWFNIWDGVSPYNDSFNYEGWEGHQELVKLNLRNPQLMDYHKKVILTWLERYHIDGLRLDVAYCMDRDYLHNLRQFTDSLKPDFLLLGEAVHGDYNTLLNHGCHSCTNYECYKGLWSSFNSMNMFEIAHSLQRQFGKEPWCLYTGKTLLNFLDNHDVERIYSILQDKNHIFPAYALLFAMPGTPSLYYGSEWGIEGKKSQSDKALRPEIKEPQYTELTDFIRRLSLARKENPALCYGDYETVHLTNRQFIFRRSFEGQSILIAINADSSYYTAHFDSKCTGAMELLSGRDFDLSAGLELPPYSSFYFKAYN